MSKFIDLIGTYVGEWFIISESEDTITSVRAYKNYNCKCSCGKIKVVAKSNLLQKRSLSCGHENVKRISNLNRTHSKSNTKEYKIYLHIKQRCYNPNNKKYPIYGGRGITMSESWFNSFESFYKDMGDAPTSKHSIDRIDVNKDYCRENCRWADNKTQANNTRKNIRVVYENKEFTLKLLSEHLNIEYKYFHRLFSKGLSIEEIIEKNNIKNGEIQNNI